MNIHDNNIVSQSPQYISHSQCRNKLKNGMATKKPSPLKHHSSRRRGPIKMLPLSHEYTHQRPSTYKNAVIQCKFQVAELILNSMYGSVSVAHPPIHPSVYPPIQWIPHKAQCFTVIYTRFCPVWYQNQSHIQNLIDTCEAEQNSSFLWKKRVFQIKTTK